MVDHKTSHRSPETAVTLAELALEDHCEEDVTQASSIEFSSL